MIVETKNGPVTLPDNPPGGGYFLTADSMQPIPITTEQLWRLAPPASPSPTPTPTPKPVPVPPKESSPTLTGWNLLFMTAFSAAIGAFLATLIAISVSRGGIPSPNPPGPNPSPPGPSPDPPVSSSLGSALKTYLSTTPGEWQRIGSQIESGQLRTQKDILGAMATISKPVWDQATPLIGSQTSPGRYTDSKGNVTDAHSLGQAISAAGKEAAQ